jgi:hypothetical protein
VKNNNTNKKPKEFELDIEISKRKITVNIHIAGKNFAKTVILVVMLILSTAAYGSITGDYYIFERVIETIAIAVGGH